jgi:hypothetical protein
MKINSNLKQIVKIANKLDELELFDSANTLTKVAVKLAQSFDEEYKKYEMRTERENEMGLDEMPMSGMERDLSLSDLENDPLMIRYKMEYKKDPIDGYNEELSDEVDSKLKDVLSNSPYSDLIESIELGDTLYILMPWLDDKMSLIDAFEDYLQEDEVVDDDDDGDMPPDFGF